MNESALLPAAELARTARVLARYLGGRRPSAGVTGQAGRRAGQGLDFLDFRNYQPGDDYRSIDWRASARSPDMQVRRYSGDVAADWFLCIDVSASMSTGGSAKWFQARRLASAFAYVLLHLGHRVGLILFSAEVDALSPLGRGQAHYAQLLAQLQQYSPRVGGGGSDVGCCVRFIPRSDTVLVISDFLAPDAMLPALTGMLSRDRTLQLLQVADDRDLKLPPTAGLLLQDVESGRTQPVQQPQTALDGAQQQWRALQADLWGFSRQYRAPFSVCDSGDHWRDVLLRHFMPG